MAGPESVRVVGLKELRAELRAIEPAGWARELTKVNKAIAEEVAAGTRSALQSMGGSAPLVAPTVKALAQQVRAQVSVGGGGQTVGELVAMGNLWGAGRYPQFPARQQGGYALYPTIAHMHDQIETRYVEMLGELLARAFPD